MPDMLGGEGGFILGVVDERKTFDRHVGDLPDTHTQTSSVFYLFIGFVYHNRLFHTCPIKKRSILTLCVL